MNPRVKTLLLSLFAGAIYPLGFAPFSWWPLSILSVAVIFFLWSRAPRSTALWSAGLYGLAVYGVGVSWVYVSMVNFGNMAPAMAAVAVILFALFLSLYFIVPVFIYTHLGNRFSERHRYTILLPVLWVVFEYLRGTLFTGFAWLYLGYVSVDTWFSGWATIAGVTAVSFVLAYLAGLFAWLFHCRRQAKVSPELRASKNRSMTAEVLLLVILLSVSWALHKISWTEPAGPSFDVTLIQADIPLVEKWRPENRENLMQTYLAASRAVDQTDLLIWPEAALPMILDEIPELYLGEVSNLNASVVFGAIEREQSPGGVQLFNSLAVVDRDNPGPLHSYRKRHLVPFGEFFPLKPVLGWLFETLNIPMSDFTSGSSQQGNISVNGMKMVPTICYEDAYPEDWRNQVAESHAILNISEDAWFGNSLAPHQRLQMARMRSIEFQRPLIRVSNSGLSTVIDDRGQVDAVSPQFQPALFTTPVWPIQGRTPYTKYGQWPLWLWISLCLGFAWMSGARNGREKKHP